MKNEESYVKHPKLCIAFVLVFGLLFSVFVGSGIPLR